jgi:plasmid stabilization system protein ParE
VRLRYTPRARRHLEAIAEYIDERNPVASRHVGIRIQETINLLTAFPHIGRKGAEPESREFVVPGLPYVVVYRIETGAADVLVILGVYHGAQRRPGQR